MSSRFKHLSKGLRRKRGEMNRSEAEYAARLDAMQAAGVIYRYWFEPMTLRLSHPPEGQPAKYTPDFIVLYADGDTCIDDVKSGGLDDYAGIVRAKCAAEQFPLWRFRLVKKQTKKQRALTGGDGWDIVEV